MGGGRIFGGITWFLGEQNGGSGSLKTLEGFRGGGHSNRHRYFFPVSVKKGRISAHYMEISHQRNRLILFIGRVHWEGVISSTLDLERSSAQFFKLSIKVRIDWKKHNRHTLEFRSNHFSLVCHWIRQPSDPVTDILLIHLHLSSKVCFVQLYNCNLVLDPCLISLIV